MAEELKPCPFCGAVPKLIEIPAEVHYYVMCIECGACGSDLHGKQDAVNAWNTRTPTGEVAALRAALEPFTNNGRVFVFVRNVEHGDYFRCLFCDGEGKTWKVVAHAEKCLITAARAALPSREERIDG